jgi:hypothetical protein
MLMNIMHSLVGNGYKWSTLARQAFFYWFLLTLTDFHSSRASVISTPAFRSIEYMDLFKKKKNLIIELRPKYHITFLYHYFFILN